MELQFESKPIRCLCRQVWGVQEAEQTQEVRLSDDMPDIGSIVCAWGQCVLRGKEWRTDSIGVSGGVMAWVLYAPSDGSEPRVVETWLPMQCKWNMADCKYEGTIRTSWLLTGVDGRMLSARKIMVRANAQVMAEAMAPGEKEIFLPTDVPEDVQLLMNSYSMQLPKEAGEKAFAIDEEMAVPGFEKMISIFVQPHIIEQAVVGGKAVFRGEANAHMVYLGQDGMIHSADREIPFSQFSDLDHDYDKEATLCVMGAMSNLETEPVENGMRLKAALVMQYIVLDREMLQIVEDAYSVIRRVECQMQSVILPAVLDRRKENLTYSADFPVRAGQMADVVAWPGHCAVRKSGSSWNLDTSGNVQMLYYDESGNLAADVQPFVTNWDVPAGENVTVNGFVRGYQQPQMHGMSAEGSVQTEAVFATDGEMTMVASLSMSEPQQPDMGRPSLILRRTGEETLWQIAKSSGSTVSAIQSANHLDAEPSVGQMLMIPVI